MIPIYKVRKHLQIPDNLDDSKLEQVLASAIRMVEVDSNRIIQKRNAQDYFDNFFEEITINKTPISSITSIQYRDSESAWQTVDSASYIIRGEVYDEFGTANSGTNYYLYPKIELESGYSWPSNLSDKKLSVRVNYVAGFEVNELPKSIETAILIVCGTLFENREGLAPVQLYTVPAYEMAISGFKRPVMA